MARSDAAKLPRRVPWLRADTALDPRERIVAAASRCLVEVGLERTSISEIARAAGVSRQTIYNYFTTRDEIITEAVQSAAAAASERIIAVAARHDTAAEFVVELCMAAIAEFAANPAISPIVVLLEQPDARTQVMTPEVIARARRYLEPILDHSPDRAPFLDEMTETFLRFELSLLTFDSAVTRDPDDLRAYLHRVLVPALGLPAVPR